MEASLSDHVWKRSRSWQTEAMPQKQRSSFVLFTLILEFDGVNSVSQFLARDASAAYQKWFRGLSNPRKYGLTEKQARVVTKALKKNRELGQAVNDALGLDDDQLTPLEGMQNAWCVVTSIAQKSVLLNVIATVRSN